MIKEVKISGMADVTRVVDAAATCFSEVGVHDNKGRMADAKSILGLMSLDYSAPVRVVSENRQALDTVCRAIAQ